MERRLDKLEEKADALDEKVTVITVDIAEIKINLQEHMRRTLAAEENNRLLKEYIDLEKLKIETRIKPLEIALDRGKFLVLLVSALGAALLLLKDLGIFSSIFKVD